METPNLDKEIEWLEWAKNGTNWNSTREKQLAEYKAIKQVLRQHNVVGQSEQLVAFLEFIEGYKMLEVDLEYQEIVRRFLSN